MTHWQRQRRRIILGFWARVFGILLGVAIAIGATVDWILDLQDRIAFRHIQEEMQAESRGK